MNNHLSSTQLKAQSDTSQIVHFLNRTSFGIKPEEIEKVKSIGIKKYLQNQLNPESIPEKAIIKQKLGQLEAFNKNPVELWKVYGDPKKARDRVKVGRQTIYAHMMRSISSNRQLQEVIVGFWLNHFNVFMARGFGNIWMGNYEEKAIRPYALGNFRDLLEATARHPAMIHYLDNWLNTAPNSPKAKGMFKGLNENYARELMELHTLGVDGGYTQDDVIALARILTGWGLTNRENPVGETGFYFDPQRHDWGDKVFLGTVIKGTGESEVEQALDKLATHPATARHISYKLAQYFVADQPPASLVNLLAKQFTATNGNIKSVLESMFSSVEFWDVQYYGTKFKTPYEYVISLMRVTNTEITNWGALLGILRQMGMTPYGCATPNGYDCTQQAWLSPDGMLARVNFATSLARGSLRQGKRVNAQELAGLTNYFSPTTKKVLAGSSDNTKSALILGSPEMMYR